MVGGRRGRNPALLMAKMRFALTQSASDGPRKCMQKARPLEACLLYTQEKF
jgi:hypothetical protein